jgi:hypothetical protein
MYSYDRRTAAMKQIRDLPEDTFVHIAPYRSGFIVEFTAADGRNEGSFTGHVEAAKAEAECGDVYAIENAEAPHGWGPLLYDLAMEYAYPKGVIPDRFSISSEAQDVWHRYFRRGDVKKRPIKDTEECEAPVWGEPFDYAYYKKPTILPRGGSKVIIGKPPS